MVRLGYHPATFPGEGLARLLNCLSCVAAEGWDGLEYSAQALSECFADPRPLRRALDDAGLELCGLYYPCGFRSDAEVDAWLDQGREVVRFCQQVGCHLVLIDGGYKPDGLAAPEALEAQIRRAAAGANAMGRICATAGLLCSWHQHWDTVFEYHAPFERLMELTDPELVRFTPDTAQLSLGDFDVAGTIDRHAARIVYAHFKDLGPDRRFAELGTGTVDFRAAWEALNSAGPFAGWIVVDLDYTALPPAQSCHLNKAYLNQTLGIFGAADHGGPQPLVQERQARGEIT